MFEKASATQLDTLTLDQPKASSFWGFRRRAAIALATPAPAQEPDFAADSVSGGFESFGRSGLQLGGLHRDQQWVGAWGGRC